MATTVNVLRFPTYRTAMQNNVVADGRQTNGGGSAVQGGNMIEEERFTVGRHQEEKATACARHAKEAHKLH